MARIKIEDIPRNRELTPNELERVTGGILIGLYQPLLSPTQLYGSYSITSLPLSGITVAGVRG